MLELTILQLEPHRYKVVESNHPRSVGGYYYEHILIVEKNIGRQLYDWETIHHINEIKKDNRIENLFLCSRPQHDKAHGMKTVSLYRLFPHWVSKECKKCRRTFWGAPSVIKNRTRCSVNCKSIKVDKACCICGNMVTIPLHMYGQWEFCSRICKRKANNDKRS